MRRSRRAYTLVELLVVVALLGIAAAVVIPSMGETGVLRVQSAVRTIVADITYAQSEAVAHQAPKAIVFYPDEGEYKLVDVVGGVVDPANNTFLTGRIAGGEMGDARIVSAEFNATATLIFDELGAPVLSGGANDPPVNGEIVVEGSGQTFRIIVEGYTGRVTVTRSESGGGS